MSPLLAFFDADETMISLLVTGWVIIPIAVTIVILARKAWDDYRNGGGL